MADRGWRRVGTWVVVALVLVGLTLFAAAAWSHARDYWRRHPGADWLSYLVHLAGDEAGGE